MSHGPDDSFDVQRVLMDRARQLAARDEVPAERPMLPRLVGLGLALIVVLVFLFAFDRFLASMQRFLALPIEDPEPVLTEPLPAYVVPAEPVAPAGEMPPGVASDEPGGGDDNSAAPHTAN